MQDNQAFRALFTLPPIQASTSTALSVPEMPTPTVVTGEREVDAVLWLQECVRTGHQVLIDKALEAAKKITTPMKELGQRYGQYLMRQHGNTMVAAFGSMGFGELESQAKNAIERQKKRQVALSYFGTVEALFSDTPAEAACEKALHGLKRTEKNGWHEYNKVQVSGRFGKCDELVPNTLADCLHGMNFSRTLYWLRHACDKNAGDGSPAFQEHENYCFRSLAYIAPRTKEEALTVLEYMEEHDAIDRKEGPAILRNLISGGWQ